MAATRYTLALLVAASLLASPAAAQKVGLIVVAHGSDSAWNAGVRKTVEGVRWTHGSVQTAWLMGPQAATESWDRAVEILQKEGVERIIAVPFMVSTFGSHTRQVEFFAGLRKELPAELKGMMRGHDHMSHVKLTVPVAVTPAIDDAPELGEALAARWATLPAADRKRPLMLIAHGPNSADDAKLWEKNIIAVASELTRRLAPHPVRVGLLRDDAGPAIRAASVASFRAEILEMATAANDSVLVLPVLISTGAINYAKLPADIAGLPVRFSPVGLTPSAALARWIERVAVEAVTPLEQESTRR